MDKDARGRARGLWETLEQGAWGRQEGWAGPGHAFSDCRLGSALLTGRGQKGRTWRTTATERLRPAESPLSLGAAQESFTGLLHAGTDAPAAGRLAGGGGASSKWLLWARGPCLHWPPGALSCAQRCWGLPCPWAPRGHTPAYPTVLSKLPPSCRQKAPSLRTW